MTPSLRIVFISLCVCTLSFAAVTDAFGHRRDYLTDQEIEVIRDAQDIDERIVSLIRMMDRRFNVLGINVNGWKDSPKSSDIWGELPKGSRAELLNDIKKLMQKAIDDIDNLAANPNAAPIREKGDKKGKKDPERFPKAVRDLAAASMRYLNPLKMELDSSTSDIEKGSIIDSIEMCDQILAAVGKLPPEVKKTEKEIPEQALPAHHRPV